MLIRNVYLSRLSGVKEKEFCFQYIQNEGISILENTCKIGLPIPVKLKTVLEQLREDKSDG